MSTSSSWIFAAAVALASSSAAWAQSTGAAAPQTPPGAAAPQSPVGDGSRSDSPFAAPTPAQRMGQVPHGDPMPRGRQDCNKANCVDNGGN